MTDKQFVFSLTLLTRIGQGNTLTEINVELTKDF